MCNLSLDSSLETKTNSIDLHDVLFMVLALILIRMAVCFHCIYSLKHCMLADDSDQKTLMLRLYFVYIILIPNSEVARLVRFYIYVCIWGMRFSSGGVWGFRRGAKKWTDGPI